MRFIIIFLIIYSSLHSQSTLNCKVSESFFEKKNFEENLSYYPLFKNLSKNYPFLNSYIKINFNNFKHYNDLIKSGDILYCENEDRGQKFHFYPSDIFVENQWYLDKINVFSAWDIFKGDSTFFVAVIDSGVDYLHEDLIDNLKYNYKDPINGIDDDNDGYIDNFYGWDFGSNDNDPYIDGLGPLAHGSSVCGIISSKTNNKIGISSPAFNCKYLPVKITNKSGNITDSNSGILYAAYKGASVINCSFGSSVYSKIEEDIINFITDSLDILVVASAGNESTETLIYPASLDNVIGVCAVDENDEKINISNFGNSFKISAPGSSIFCPTIDNNYTYFSGTSLSSAIVSSAAILLRSFFKNENVTEIKNRIINSTDRINKQNIEFINLLGSGRLNIFEAFNYNELKTTNFEIYPNPSNGIFFITFYSNLNNNLNINIYDFLGKKCYSNNLNSNILNSIDISSLKSGNYIIELKNSEISSFKIINKN